mmetsp:Transcript_6228/g.11135  ORF Transcript_6228/g.11135 Transcript_6228/m.11135 type:complete len:274 (-) Transcript_6228:101-922(-)
MTANHMPVSFAAGLTPTIFTLPGASSGNSAHHTGSTFKYGLSTPRTSTASSSTFPGLNEPHGSGPIPTSAGHAPDSTITFSKHAHTNCGGTVALISAAAGPSMKKQYAILGLQATTTNQVRFFLSCVPLQRRPLRTKTYHSSSRLAFVARRLRRVARQVVVPRRASASSRWRGRKSTPFLRIRFPSFRLEADFSYASMERRGPKNLMRVRSSVQGWRLQRFDGRTFTGGSAEAKSTAHRPASRCHWRRTTYLPFSSGRAFRPTTCRTSPAECE